MPEKSTYEELEQKTKKLENDAMEYKAKQAHLDQLLSYIPVVFYTCRLSGDYGATYISKNIKKQLGYEPQDFTEDPEFWIKNIHPEDKARVLAKLSQVLPELTSKDVYNHDYRFKIKNGTYRWMKDEFRLILDADGNPLEIAGYWVDITERKQAEKKLQKSEMLHKEAQSVAQIGHWELDSPSGKPLWSEEVFHIFGLDPKKSEPSFSAHVNIIHDEDWDLLNHSIQELSTQGTPFDIEFRILRPDGEIHWMHAKGSAYKGEDGSIVRMFGTAQDIIKHKQAEEALRESEQKFRSVFENSPLAIVHFNKFGLVTACNENLCKITGSTPNKLIGLDTKKELKDETMLSAISNALAGHKSQYQGEYLSVTGGIFTPVRALYAPIISDNDEIIGAIGILEDISEQLTAEREKLKLMARLQQSQKMESIGTLTSGIAHDFNNIMGIILGNTELALEDVPEWNPAHSNLEEIKKVSLRAANIVRQLLSFTRITDQKLQPMEIALVIKDALKFLRSTIATTIDIEQDICVTDETILADPTQINQIMMNLCINASQAMEQTGGNLTISVDNVLLDDHSAKDYPGLKSGKHIKVVVMDTGPGIDPKIIDRIFDPYFTTKGVGKGSGMGLAVVHGIVKSHSGSITVDSTLGKGTKFSILFPLAQEKAAVETQTIQEIPRGSETIFFVDDEISIVNMVQRMFERLGYKVQTAITHQDALDRFALNPDHFDLVITDMTMPQMTGVNLSEKLMDIRPDIPIIICTGYSALVDEEKAKELGLAAFVMKPINLSEIAQTIRKVLDRK